MIWVPGKANITVAAIGDSNVVGSGGCDPNGGQSYNPKLYCRASEFGQVPYDEANLGWYSLDNNGPSRVLEVESSIAQGNVGFVGQVLCGNGAPGMQLGNTIQVGTDCDRVSLYQCGAGGTTAAFWANGDGWDTLARTIPTALSTAPDAPTYFDAIYISLGGNDANTGVTSDQFYTNMQTLRQKMVDEGWWVPGTTQIVIGGLPENGSIPRYTNGDFQGIQYVLSRFNDRIAYVDFDGFEYAPDGLNVHPLPPYYTDAGRRAGEKVLALIPPQQSTLSIGGVRLKLGGKRLYSQPQTV
jgi:hypothetical protein